MTINCVVKPGWILERFAKELARHVRGVKINSTGYPPKAPSPEPLSYFLPMKDVRHMAGVRGVKVGLFTHGEERCELYASRFDACVTMNEKMAAFLRSVGARNVRAILPGAGVAPKPIRFGVVGRVYGKGRKGANLVEAAVSEGFDFAACSERQRRGPPPCPITHAIEKRSAFYQTIDYLVVPSIDEGGPMPVLEAIAHGIPIIAPDVGFCWEFPVIRYERNSWPSLRNVLLKLTRPPMWKEWASAHGSLFESLLKNSEPAAMR